MAELAKQGKPVTRLSMIGYSMGGLMNRYTAGKLYAEGVFDEGGVTPVNFITVATPHLGAWRLPVNLLNRAFNYLVPVTTSRSGYQIMLQDQHVWGKPLMCLMSHPDLLFMRALRRFKRLALYANVFHDRPVPYCTAAIRLDNPYEGGAPPVPIDPAFPSIVRTADSAAADAAAGGKAAGGKGAGPGAGAGGGVSVSPLYSGPDLPDPDDATPVRAAELQPLKGGGGAAAAGGAAGAAAAAQPLPPPKLRPLRNTYIKYIAVLFLPLAIPALIMMVLTGRSHLRRMQRQGLTFQWIADWHAKHGGGLGGEGKAGAGAGTAGAGKGKGQAAAAAAAAAATAASSGKAEPLPGKDAVDEEKGGGAAATGREAAPSDIECPAAPDVPLRTATSASANVTTVTVDASATPAAAAAAQGDGAAAGAAADAPTGPPDAPAAPRRSLTVTVAPAEGTAAGAGDDGEDGVLVSEADVLLHDGIVEAPADMHAVQEWLVDKLNTLPWHKVDVDVRDWHAHAAIIVRNPRRFTACRDAMTHLVDHFARE
ncbi:hypothetical protein HYH02_007531 [Chlamydomonas schloesseri]|uniref:DUF676 domain-containing protein n=1 Tax=Chlamydomonas schloesseri TaxID=2026947 RepID=A0A835WHN9_9CHLO|nr:hypothetical protein HYH02_007531 [Chlamydomonas schloesseri]|eukprot:KAG2447611.1 hypothetical protein HYH02_007531 [Chlamydomonas schloesseri]